MTVYSILFSIYLIQKYEYFRTGYYDFGLGVQTVWLASTGRLNGLALGRPINILAGGIYAVYPHPETLLALQSYALAVGALAIYLLARRELGNPWYALAFSQLYLISPVLWGINQYEYHDLAFCVPFLLFAAYFYSLRRIRPYLVSLAFALTTSPFVGVIALAMVGSLAIQSYRDPRLSNRLAFPLTTAASTLVFILYLEILPLLPSFSQANVGTSTYTFFGSTAYVNPLAAVRDPIGSIGYAWLQKGEYLLELLGPVLFLPVASKHRFLPALPWLGVVVSYTPTLGSGGLGPVYQFSQWSSFLLPFVFIGGIYGLKQIRSSMFRTLVRVRTKTILVVMIVLMILVGSFSSGLSPFGPQTELSVGDNTIPTQVQQGSLLHGIWPTPVRDRPILDWFVAQIPLNYSVLTQNQLGSKLGERFAPVYVFYSPGYKDLFADAILVDYNLEGLCTSCLNNILTSESYVIHLSYKEGGIFLYYKAGLA